MNKFKKLTIAATLGLALKFTFNCSGVDSPDLPPIESRDSSGTENNSSSSGEAVGGSSSSNTENSSASEESSSGTENSSSSSGNTEISSSGSSSSLAGGNSSSNVSSSSSLPSSSSSLPSSSSLNEPGANTPVTFDGAYFIDPRDNKRYRYMIDPDTKLSWMAENLNYSRGGTIGWCYIENSDVFGGTGVAGSSGAGCNSPYGRNYTWEIVMDGNSKRGLCPYGWHIPSTAEWQTLDAETYATATATRKMSTNFYVMAGKFGRKVVSGGSGWNWMDRGSRGFYWANDSKNNYTEAGFNYFITRSDAAATEYFSARCVSDEIEEIYIPSGLLIDLRDAQTYKTVEIGTQVWTAENMNYETPLYQGNPTSMCYDNEPANCTKYGRLYDGWTAPAACPEGWHLPSGEEWETLVSYIENDMGCTNCAARFLKAQSGWSKYNGLDSYGFAALPGGVFDKYSNNVSKTKTIGTHGYWWGNNNESDVYAYSFGMTNSVVNGDDIVSWDSNIKNDGFTSSWGSNTSKEVFMGARCVKD